MSLELDWTEWEYKCEDSVIMWNNVVFFWEFVLCFLHFCSGRNNLNLNLNLNLKAEGSHAVFQSKSKINALIQLTTKQFSVPFQWLRNLFQIHTISCKTLLLHFCAEYYIEHSLQLIQEIASKNIV